MERHDQKKQERQLNKVNYIRSTSSNPNYGNPIDFHPSDVINVNNLFSHDPCKFIFLILVFGQIFSHLQMVPLQQSVDPMQEYEDQMLNEICPNPDQMTYEQLLELQEKVGHENRGFTHSEIDKIATVKYNKSKMKNNDKCTVCLFEYKESEILRKLTCGHTYHKSCVDEWLLQDKKCPVCKGEVKL